MFSLVRYGPLWPCSLRGRSRARVLDIPPRHFLADFQGSAHSEAALAAGPSAGPAGSAHHEQLPGHGTLPLWANSYILGGESSFSEQRDEGGEEHQWLRCRGGLLSWRTSSRSSPRRQRRRESPECGLVSAGAGSMFRRAVTSEE